MNIEMHRHQKTINLAAVGLMSRLMIELDTIHKKNSFDAPTLGSPSTFIDIKLSESFYAYVAQAALAPVQALVATNIDLTPETIYQVPELIIETFIVLIERRHEDWKAGKEHLVHRHFADDLTFFISELRFISQEIKQATADLPFDYGR